MVMQDKYAGDIGDYAKLGLLRALKKGRKLGVAWYRVPDETGSPDGKYTEYLKNPELFRRFDPDLFDHLHNVVFGRKKRRIKCLEPVLQDATFSDELLITASLPKRQRSEWRRNEWFNPVLKDLSECDLVFADPDNGIVDDQDWRRGNKDFCKKIPLEEVHALARGRCAVIYHHNTREKHVQEIDRWLGRIEMPAVAVRARRYSARTFFVINPDTEIEERVRAFTEQWACMRVELHEPREF